MNDANNSPEALKAVLYASEMAFGRRLVANHFRGHLVEAIVASALEPTWKWVAFDWASWDFEREDGLRVEVKQSAALQSWHNESRSKATLRFDIRERSGYWHEGQWHSERRRPADFYIFAAHQVLDLLEVDHREPGQWTFYVMAASSLPPQQSIGLRAIQAVARPHQLETLLDELQRMATQTR